MTALPSGLNHLLKAPSANTITFWGVGFKYMSLGGNTNIQTTAGILWVFFFLWVTFADVFIYKMVVSSNFCNSLGKIVPSIFLIFDISVVNAILSLFCSSALLSTNCGCFTMTLFLLGTREQSLRGRRRKCTILEMKLSQEKLRLAFPLRSTRLKSFFKGKVWNPSSKLFGKP